jgi:hypothetical protein
MAITYTEVQENLAALSKSVKPESYIYDFLLCFGTAKASITRLKKKFESTSEITSNGQILFKEGVGNLDQILTESLALRSLKKNKIRFVIVTDYKTIFAHDIKSDDTIEIVIDELHYEFEFFLPLAGMERASLSTESVADAKAAEKMAKLFDLLKADNEIQTEEQIHSMNVFLSRILFCFFAEDTGIFQKDQFTKAIGSLSQENGSDVHEVLKELFDILDTTNRENCSNNFKSFPYVNGGLFADDLILPRFTVRSRRALIESGSLDWSKINPDIFGSMIQAVMDTKKRSEMGMHYTSVQNIMKVLSPLFLDKLTEEYLKILDSDVKDTTKVNNLKALCTRLSKIKVGDMACGSGNFLIIAFKELRNLEMTILKEIRRLEGAVDQINLLLGAPNSGITIGQFYGIEYDDFASGIAELSLWLVEHQMNQKFNDEFGANEATLPLKSYNNIVKGNALRLDWADILPSDGEVFLVGNPPFLGSSIQEKWQKEDMSLICKGFPKYKNLDYVSAWFIKGKEYILNNSAECAFVATNSICQGDSVACLWKNLLDLDIEIGFAHRSFKWSNNAKNKAGVTCVIVSLRKMQNQHKYIYDGELKTLAKNINAYLIAGENVFVEATRTSISKLPMMIKGHQPTDDGNFILTTDEKNDLIKNFPNSEPFIKKYIGSDEIVKGKVRWCIWIKDNETEIVNEISPIRDRIDEVEKVRALSKAPTTRVAAKIPHRFIQINSYQETSMLLVPSVTSENRLYITADFYDAKTIPNNLCFAIYNPEKYLFSLLSCKHHLMWVKAVGGALETRIRYSNTLCYNTFPTPNIELNDKKKLEGFADRIIKERVSSGGELGKLYEAKNIPETLKNTHEELDHFVDSLYQKTLKRANLISSDVERLEVLFKLYARSKEEV